MMLVDFLHNTNSVERSLVYDEKARIIERFDGTHWLLANDDRITMHDLGDARKLLQYEGVLFQMPKSAIKPKKLKQGKDYNGQSVRAVVICNNKLLLVQRGLSCCHSPGSWELPGGRRDHGETLHESVRRELTEETALIALCASNQPMHVLDNFVPEQMWTEYYYKLRLKSPSYGFTTAAPQHPETKALTWCSLDDVRSMMDSAAFTYSALYFLDGWLRQLNGDNFDESAARQFADRKRKRKRA